MAANAAAAAALRFDIVADRSQFTREVEQIRADFKAAAEEMQSAWAGIGGKIAEAAGRAWEGLESLSQQAQAAIAGGAKGVEQGLLDGLDKVKEASQRWLETGLTSLGQKYLGKFGAQIGKDLAGMAASLWDPIARAGANALSGDGPIGRSFQGLLSMIEQQAPEAERAFSFLGLKGAGDKVKETVEGIRNAIAVIKGEQLPTKEFEAILAVLEKQTEQYQLQFELLGKTAAEAARIRAERALDAAGANLDGMGEDQRKKFEEKLDELAAAAQKNDDTRTGMRQAESYKQIVQHLERQVELENVKADRLGLTVGQLAEQRAIEDAILRMKVRGRDLTEAERREVEQWAKALGHAADEAARANLERTTTIGFERQAANARIEFETLGMATAAAVAYRSEMQAIARFKEQMIPPSDEMAARIRDEATALGEQAARTAQLRDSLTTLRDTGQTVARALENAFDKWIEGTKINVREMVASILADLAKLTLRTQVLQPLFGGGAGGGSGMIGDLFAGMFRAEGGPVSPNQPYIVGEKRPELFVPNTAGSIVPYVPQMQSSGRTTNLALTINAPNSTPESINRLRNDIPALVMQIVTDARERGAMA